MVSGSAFAQPSPSTAVPRPDRQTAAVVPTTPLLPASDLPDNRALLDAAERLIARGRTAELEALLVDRPDTDAMVAIVRARADARVGEWERARQRLRRVAMLDPRGEAALDLGLLLQQAGRREEAEKWLAPLVAFAGEVRDGAALARGARAARATGQFRLANALFRDAAAAAPGAARIETAWGGLFLEKHNVPEAVRSFERALTADAEYVPAMVGLARALADENPPAAAARARQAIGIDAGAWEAHLLLAELALDRRDRDQARAHIADALAHNPHAPDAFALRAALAAVEGRAADLEADAAAVLAINPKDARAWRVPSDHVAAHYRFEEAVALARRAVAVDPEDPAARSALGMHLMRTGDEEAARTELDLAFARDPYDVVTHNLLNLLDTLQTFQTVREGDLIFKFHPDEVRVLEPFAPALAREALASMSARYGFTPTGPILVELFPSHDDFAVRTLGLPGMIGALGACFGRVVTLDSPRARPPGSFHWGATLWHELAHVMALQLSRQRVPRWFTEGLSVYEERLARPTWGRESELDFVRGLDEGAAIPLALLNDGFSDPRRIALAYQQASLVIEFLDGRFGFDAITRMLRAYGEGLDDAAVFARELRSDAATLQAGFDAFLVQRYGAMRAALRVPEGVELDAGDLAALRETARRHESSYPVQMAAAGALLAAGAHAEAIPYLERAAVLVPIADGPEGPRALLAKAALGSGDRARAMRELEAALAVENTAIEAARELAVLATEAGDLQRQVLAHTRLVEVVPHESAPHTVLGRLAFSQGDAASALRSFRVALAAGPDDPVAARTDHAEALLQTGQAADARLELLSALAEAPLYRRAQDLLLAIVDAPRGAGVRR
jgi:tetratricopeptide (TPR) repeat protein